MQIDVNEDLHTRLTTEGPAFEKEWATFIFNVPKLKLLLDETKDILNAGLLFNGGGLSTGTLSKTLYQVSGVAMVKWKPPQTLLRQRLP